MENHKPIDVYGLIVHIAKPRRILQTKKIVSFQCHQKEVLPTEAR